jgi:hypothetical protein
MSLHFQELCLPHGQWYNNFSSIAFILGDKVIKGVEYLLYTHHVQAVQLKSGPLTKP